MLTANVFFIFDKYSYHTPRKGSFVKKVLVEARKDGMKKVYQRDLKDCGVTCLSYIIQYYKGYVSMERLREDTNTNEQGCTAFDLVETLKKYHFDAIGQKISFQELSSAFFPVIAHLILENGLNHFVVLTKVNKKYVVVMDPAIGYRKISHKEFQRLWDGIILQAIPNNIIPKLPKEKSVLKSLLIIMKQEKNLFLKIIFFNFLATILTLLSSFYLKIGLSGILKFNDSTAFIELVFSFGLLLLIRLFLNYGKDYLKLYLNKNIEATFLYAFLNHILKIPLRKFQTYLSGEIITRIEETKEIKNLFSDICITFFLESFLGGFSLMLLFLINHSLFYLLLFGMLCYLVIGCLTSKFFFSLVLERMESEAEWKSNIMDHIHLMPTVKHLNAYLFRRQNMEIALCKNIELTFEQEKKALRLQILKNYYLEFLFFLITSFGIYRIYQNQLCLLDFVTFQNLYLYFVSPLKELVDMLPKFYYMKGIILKISEYAAIPEEEEYTEVTLFAITHLKFENLTFSYNYFQKNLVEISFEVNAKEHVFLKGKSGAGKSTICKLLIKELLDYQGDIWINHQNLKDLPLSNIRKSIVYLSQNETLLHDTIKENILFGREITNDKFQKVTNICQIEEIVSKKPLRYESVVDDYMLSGGERQRLMLARALLSNASVYLLDECLSEIEEVREKEIIKGIRNYLQEKIVVYISHRNLKKQFERVIEIGNKQL